jgi:signal transduction histidine kinase
LINAENIKEFSGMVRTHEDEKKEKKIEQLNENLEKSKNEEVVLSSRVKQMNVLVISLLLLAIMCVMTIYLFFNRQKLKQKSRYDSALLTEQKKAASAIMAVQEEERNLIAKDLHDGIGTYISTIKINLQALESSVDKRTRDLMKNTAELIDKTSVDLRTITKNLSSEILMEQDLPSALSDLTERINTSRLLKINFVGHGISKKLSAMEELNLYRIGQELLNNCLRHSAATQACLQLIEHEDCMIMIMEDNGSGFDAGEKRKGMGLKNIEHRVKFMGGKFKIESASGKGSTFIIELPFKTQTMTS